MKRLTLIALFVFAIYSQTTVGQPDDRGAILAPGNPPLTEAMVKKSLDLAEWALEMSLSPEERSGVREFFVESWRRGDQNGVIEAAEMYDTISRMPADDKASLRQKLRDLMLQNLQRDPNGRINHIFLSAHRRASSLPPIPVVSAAEPVNPDGISWDLTKAVALTDTQARALLSSTGPISSGSTQSLTYTTAMERVRKLVSDTARVDELSAFHSSGEARSADSLAAVAAGAIIAEMPLLSLTALLRAHQLEPTNPTHLANLAAVLTFIEMPAEALAVINSAHITNGRLASPLGLGGQAGVLNTQGLALLQLGRASEAETSLRKAVELSPNFAEAKVNLAFALWAQHDPKKKEEGVRFIGSVWRVRPGKTMFDIVERPHKTREPHGEIEVDLFAQSQGGAMRIDTSKGKRLTLPDLKIPTTLEAAASMAKKFVDLKLKTEELLLLYGQGKLSPGDTEDNEAAVRKSIESYSRLPPETLLARQQQIESIREKLEPANVQSQPAVRPHWEKLRQVFRESYSNIQTPVTTSIPMAGSAEVGPAGVELYKRLRELEGNRNYNRLACAAARNAHSRWLVGINAYDQALREYLNAAYFYMTGVLANVHDPIEHKRLEIDIREHVYTEWRNLIHYANGFYDFGHRAVGPNGWCNSAPGPGDDLGDLHADAADRCPEGLKGKNKVTLEFVIAKLSFNCESIGVEIGVGLGSPLAAPKWLKAFVELEARFKDGKISKFRGMTIGAGVKSDAGESLPTKLSVKAGAYVKVGSDGEVLDGGLKISGTAASNTGPITVKTGAGYDLSFAPAFRAFDSAIERLVQ